jgi:hypothetical protein
MAANDSAGDQSNAVPKPTDQPALPQAKSTPETLKLVLPSDEEGGEHHYAIVAFPETYKVCIIQRVQQFRS